MKNFLIAASLFVFSLSSYGQKYLTTTTSTANQSDEVLHIGKIGLGQRNTGTDVVLYATPQY